MLVSVCAFHSLHAIVHEWTDAVCGVHRVCVCVCLSLCLCIFSAEVREGDSVLTAMEIHASDHAP